MKRFFSAFLSLGLLTLACSDASEVSQVELDPTDIQLVNRLIPFDDCEGVLGHLKEEAMERVGPYGLDNTGFPIWIGLQEGVVRSEVAVMDSAPAVTMAAEESVAYDSGSVSSGSSGEINFTGTNVQELGVDEPDIIKTDGERILVNASNNPQPGIRITGGDTQNIRITESRIDGQNAKNAIEITGSTELPENWPSFISIEQVEAFGTQDDIIRVNGANHIVIKDCHLHDPAIPQNTTQHIDAIQVIRARTIYIHDNWITFTDSSASYQRNEGTNALNPHQGIILSTTANQTISHFEIRRNHFVEWTPGTPIIVSGSGVSEGIVYGNQLLDCIDYIVFGDTLGSNIRDFANTTESSQ